MALTVGAPLDACEGRRKGKLGDAPQMNSISVAFGSVGSGWGVEGGREKEEEEEEEEEEEKKMCVVILKRFALKLHFPIRLEDESRQDCLINTG